MPDTSPLISIVLPTYNGSAYLRESIESCLAQTYSNWELILVDDCSSDATPQIIASYERGDRRIRNIRHQKNRRLPAALNTGHAAARGDYLTWTSDDNRFLPAALEEMARFLQEHPTVGLVYADSVLIDDNGEYLGDWPAQPASRLAYMNAVGACFLYRRALYQAVGGYDEQQFLAEDWDFWLRAAYQFQLAPLHQVLYEYRWHGRSLTKAVKRLEVQASIERALRRHLPHLRHSSRQDLGRGWTVCAANAARRGDFLQAITAYGRALRTAPGSSMAYVAKKLMDRVKPHRESMPLPTGDWA